MVVATVAVACLARPSSIPWGLGSVWGDSRIVQGTRDRRPPLRYPKRSPRRYPERTTRPTAQPLEGDDWVFSKAAGGQIRKEDGSWLWQGFQHSWKNDPHRLRNLQSRYVSLAYNFRPDSGESGLSGRLVEEQRVGECADKLDFRTYKKGIKTGVAEFRDGSVAVTLTGKVDQCVERTFTETVSLEGLEKYSKVTLFMRGFQLEEDAGGAGQHCYPTRGFGLKVSRAKRAGDSLEFDLKVMLHPAPKPLNIAPTPKSWRYRVQYDYTLVGGNDGEFSFTHGSKQYRGIDVATNQGDCPRVSAQKRQTTIEGEYRKGNVPYSNGVVVFRGFFVKVNARTDGLSGDQLKYRGRIVREVWALIHGQTYDPATRAATFTPEIYFSNKSGAQYAMNTSYEGLFTLLQFHDPDQWAESATLRDAGDGADQRTVDGDDQYKYAGALKSTVLRTP